MTGIFQFDMLWVYVLPVSQREGYTSTTKLDSEKAAFPDRPFVCTCIPKFVQVNSPGEVNHNS